MVFEFSSEVQKIVENTTIVMDIQWRWHSDTFEMIVSINDDNDIGEFPVSDYLGVLFDSDHNGRFSTEEDKSEDDHCAYIALNGSESINRVVGKAFTLGNLSRAYFWAPKIATLNNSYYTYNEGLGYEFFLSIPIESINVTSPTPIHLSFYDLGGLVNLIEEQHVDWTYHKYFIISTEFEV